MIFDCFWFIFVKIFMGIIKSFLYLCLGSVISTILNHYFSDNLSWGIDFYHGFAFGLGWGLAYFVDHPEWTLVKKMGISLIGVFILVILGFILFNFEIAILSIIKFSTVFVAYYMIASFRESKSLRN